MEKLSEEKYKELIRSNYLPNLTRDFWDQLQNIIHLFDETEHYFGLSDAEKKVYRQLSKIEDMAMQISYIAEIEAADYNPVFPSYPFIPEQRQIA
ncbi:MAG: hypothetical protein QM669_13560 [Siphonobacter sp.]